MLLLKPNCFILDHPNPGLLLILMLSKFHVACIDLALNLPLIFNVSIVLQINTLLLSAEKLFIIFLVLFYVHSVEAYVCSQSTVIQTRVLGLARETLTWDFVDSDLSQRARDLDSGPAGLGLDSDSGPAGLSKGRIRRNPGSVWLSIASTIYLYSLQSSTNINRSEPHDLARSFIKIMKSNRLKMLPCGIPPRGGTRHELGGLNP